MPFLLARLLLIVSALMLAFKYAFFFSYAFKDEMLNPHPTSCPIVAQPSIKVQSSKIRWNKNANANATANAIVLENGFDFELPSGFFFVPL